MQLQPGQNTPLAQPRLDLDVTLDGVPAGMDLDLSAFLLGDSGKVFGDEGMVFYGAPASADGAVRLDVAARRFSLDLERVPAGVTKLAIVVTIDQGVRRGQRFGQLGGVRLRAMAGNEEHVFALAVGGMAETAVILAEVYQRQGQWKLRAVGQGFTGGLGPLARHYGVDISDDPDATGTGTLPAAPAPAPPPQATPPVPTPIPAPAPAPPPAPAPLPSRVSLTKITLEKARPVSLDKADGRFGEIVVNLRWTKGGGFFARSIDLDLGAMIELHDGGKTVVQALGRHFGTFAQAPFAQLMGDDRSGASGQGEFLRINGDRWASIKRVLIFATIYEGVPNWAQADGFISIRMPGQPEIETRLDSPNARDHACAIAVLENVGGAVRATKLVDYFPGLKHMDQRFGFGFQWTTGTK